MLSHLSCVWLFMTPRTVACQTPLSMRFSRQEYRSELPCPPPGDLPDSGIEPVSLMSPALAGRFLTTSAAWEAQGSLRQAIMYDYNDKSNEKQVKEADPTCSKNWLFPETSLHVSHSILDHKTLLTGLTSSSLQNVSNIRCLSLQMPCFGWLS